MFLFLLRKTDEGEDFNRHSLRFHVNFDINFTSSKRMVARSRCRCGIELGLRGRNDMNVITQYEEMKLLIYFMIIKDRD